MRSYRILLFVPLMPFFLVSLGCSGQSSAELSLDPLKLIENLEAQVKKHHPTKYGEISVGEFYLTLPIEDSIDTYRLDFSVTLVATKGDVDQLESRLAEREGVVRDLVIATAQRMTTAQLLDPDLVWLKTELVSVLRSELQSTAIRDVVFSDFAIERG